MIPLLVAMLTASSTFAALWPLMRSEVPRFEVVRREYPDSTLAGSRACARRITVIRTIPQRGTITKGCSSARKRPCVRRRHW